VRTSNSREYSEIISDLVLINTAFRADSVTLADGTVIPLGNPTAVYSKESENGRPVSCRPWGCRCRALGCADARPPPRAPAVGSLRQPSKYATSLWEQTQVLCRRSFINSTRTWGYFVSWILGLAMFLFYGTLYLGYAAPDRRNLPTASRPLTC